MINKNWRTQITTVMTSQAITMLGSSISGFAIVWYIALKTGSGVWMTYATLANLVPGAIVSLFGGVFADRYNRKILAIFSDMGIALITLVMAILYQLGYQSLWMLLILLAARSVGTGIQTPAASALVPQIVPEEHLPRVNGLNQTINSISQLAGPALGGVIFGTVGLVGSFWVDVITATIGISVFSFVKVQNINKERVLESVFKEMHLGINYVKKSKVLTYLFASFFAFWILITPSAFLAQIFIERTYSGDGVFNLTVMETAWSVGTLLGGVAVSWHGVIKNKIRMIFAVMAIDGIAFGLMVFMPNNWLFSFVMMLGGLAMPWMSTAHTTLLQEIVEPTMMGRVFSVVNIISMTAMPLGMVAFGPLGDIIDLKLIFALTGLLSVVLAAWFYYKMRHFKIERHKQNSAQ